MPKKLPNDRVATAKCIATLLRIYRSATCSADQSLRMAADSELRQKYGIVASELIGHLPSVENISVTRIDSDNWTRPALNEPTSIDRGGLR